MESLYKSILELYVDERYLDGSDVRDIQYRNPENFVALQKVDPGPRVNAELRNIHCPPAEVIGSQTKCLNFLVELSHQIYQRFPFRSAEVDILQYV